MFTKEELLEGPEYLLTKYQNEIYHELLGYMRSNNLTQKDIAKKLGVSNSYVSQALNGHFNFTLTKLIELGLMMKKVPTLEFLEFNAYWEKEREATRSSKKTHRIKPKTPSNVIPLGAAKKKKARAS